jgi:hypothetical protein
MRFFVQSLVRDSRSWTGFPSNVVVAGEGLVFAEVVIAGSDIAKSFARLQVVEQVNGEPDAGTPSPRLGDRARRSVIEGIVLRSSLELFPKKSKRITLPLASKIR